jgi:uncharacterized membrane protein YedE/YeeE
MRIDSPGKLLLGLGTGVVFGALLQKGRAAKYDVIIDQLLLRDGTVARIMGTAVAVGSAGVHALQSQGYGKLEVKPLQLGGVLGGGLLFGAGMAILGYCPGTTLAALGEGRRDAIAGALGMLTGAALFVRVYPTIKPALEAGDYGKVTLPGATATSPWPWVGAVGTAVALAGTLFGRRPSKPRVGSWLRRFR